MTSDTAITAARSSRLPDELRPDYFTLADAHADSWQLVTSSFSLPSETALACRMLADLKGERLPCQRQCSVAVVLVGKMRVAFARRIEELLTVANDADPEPEAADDMGGTLAGAYAIPAHLSE